MISNNIQYSTGISPQNQEVSYKKKRYLPLPRYENGRTSVNPYCPAQIMGTAYETIKHMHYNARMVLDKLLTYKNHYLRGSKDFKSLHMTHETIAKEIGCHVDTVRVWIKYLYEHGFIGKVYRHRKSCLYYLNSMFLDVEFRIKVKQYLPSLSGVPSALLKMSLFALAFTGTGKGLPDGFFVGTPSQSNYKENVFYKKPYRNPSLYHNLFPSQTKTERETERERLGETVRISKLELTAYGREFKKTDQERIMEAQIPHYVQNIRSLDLTEAGMIRLSKYPEAVIQYADEYVSGSYSVDKPFEYFAKCCWQEANRRNLSMDYGTVNRLAAKYGITEESPNLKTQEIIRWHTKKPQSIKSTVSALQGGRPGTLPSATPVSQAKKEAAQHIADNRVRDGIRKQISERKEQERKLEEHDQYAGIREFAQMVTDGTVPWESEEHRKMGEYVARCWFESQEQSIPFRNPLLHMFQKPTPQPPFQTQTNLSGEESKFLNHTEPLPNYKMKDWVEISFIPEDSVVHDRDQWNIPIGLDDEWQEVYD